MSSRQNARRACVRAVAPYAEAMQPIEAARASLLGLAVGDAFGSMLDDFGPELARKAALRLISTKRPWRWTDDTAMAISIVEVLEQHGTIDQDALAAALAARFAREPGRGYGAGAHALLTRVSAGAPWRAEAPALFIKSQEGTTQLVNYRVKANWYIVDRLFEEAELRVGEQHPAVVRIVRQGR